jgi:dienelactone hydrolase
MAAVVFALAVVDAWAQAPIPVEAFFQKPAVASAVISPTGRHVAMTSLNNEDLLQLVILDTATLKASVIASFQKADIVNVHWVSDKRLVYGAGDSERQLRIAGTGLHAVDLDGGDYRQLARASWDWDANDTARRVLDATTEYEAPMPLRDSDSIFATQLKWNNDGTFQGYSILKVDTRTGAASPVQRPADIYAFSVAPDGVARVVMTREAMGRSTIQYRDGDNWVKLVEFDLFTGQGAFYPVGFAPDGTLYVSYSKDGGTSGLYTYDIRTRQLSNAPVLSVAGFDMQPGLVTARNGLVGVHYSADARATYWIDPRMKELQGKIDKALPATVNHIQMPNRAEVPFLLVHAFSDADPGQYFLYDTKDDKLMRIGRSRPAIDPTRGARLDFARFKARDGMEIPVWITTPKDGKTGARPAVVLVHGGPNLRGGYWGWDAEAQFLASRGYLVIEPEFRGSQGFGFNHFKAGWKQWGLAMQNDVADATRWAIEKGYADAKRICIAGASYGGYAALMGLASDVDLYRCGFEWAGVTDLDLLYSDSWRSTSDAYRTYGLPTLVGDRTKDAAQLKATSPITVAAKIKQPLLMAYGAQDHRVPIVHGTRFRDEVQKVNANVEWVVYADEGHGWSQVKNNVDWWTRVEKFLARNIGEGAAR